MGREYILFKPEKKERFDLAKGYWTKVFKQDIQFKIREIYTTSFDLWRTLVSEIAYEFDTKLT